jgi:hypothetical protein
MHLHWIPDAGDCSGLSSPSFGLGRLERHTLAASGREVYFGINHRLEDVDADNSVHFPLSNSNVEHQSTFRF